MTRSLTLWRLTDGKPGHEKQTLGLAQALARLGEVWRHDLPVTDHGVGPALMDWLLGRFPPGRGLPDPDLILAAGHATHLPALAARRARGGRIVLMMRPSLPLALFDLCLIPAHDRPPARHNVLVTHGTLNCVEPGRRHDPHRGLILIGGPSRHYRWDDGRVAAAVREIVTATPKVRWRLTTSRRTTAGFLAALGSPEGLEIRPWDATPPGWLEEELARSLQVWASPDSVSMVYEALTAGCQVGLLELDAAPASRIAQDMNALAEQGAVTPYARWRETHVLSPAPAPLHEARRCAEAILRRWYA